MISKYLNPKNDTAFKRIFGEERNKDIVISLLNSVLTEQFHKKIVDVEFLKTEQVPHVAAAKKSSVDIVCKDQDGCRYIIEMQVAKQAGFEKRAQYYASKAYIDQAPNGGKWKDLKEVIFLAFADYRIFDEKEHYKSEHVTLDRKTLERNLKDFSFTFINMPKFMEKYQNSIPDNLEEKFYYFLCKADELTAEQVEELVKSEKILRRAFNELDIINWPDEKRRAYEEVENIERSYRSNIDDAKEEGEKIGIEKGKKEGKKETLDDLEQRAQNLVKQGVITQEQADAMLKN